MDAPGSTRRMPYRSCTSLWITEPVLNMGACAIGQPIQCCTEFCALLTHGNQLDMWLWRELFSTLVVSRTVAADHRDHRAACADGAHASHHAAHELRHLRVWGHVMAGDVRTSGVLNTRHPPGRSHWLMRRSAPAVSWKKIMPLAHSAASKLPAGSSRSSTSPTSNRVLRSPSCSAFLRACKTLSWGRKGDIPYGDWQKTDNMQLTCIYAAEQEAWIDICTNLSIETRRGLRC